MDKSQVHYVRRKKPNSKGYTLYDPIYMVTLEKEKSQGYKSNSSICLGWEGVIKKHEGIWGGDGNTRS